MTVPFGGEVFTISTFLVFCNRFANLLYAVFMGMAMREPLQLQAPCWKYMLISLSNVAATSFQYESLKYVSFPVLMLGKSFKMMPVMAWSTMISGQKYSALDWIVAGFVTCGVSMFCLAGPISPAPWDSAGTIKGMFLVLAFLVCDGLTATMQEKMFREDGTSKFNQMFYVNLFSFFTSLVTLLACNNLLDGFAFGARHGDFVGQVGLLSMASVASQFFIYSQVMEFGAVVFAATINVRQIVSILVSNVVYHHSINDPQSVGLFSVFAALFLKGYTGIRTPTDKKEKCR